MIIELVALPANKVRGIYTVGGVPNQMPERTRFLHPEAAISFLHDLADQVTVSDVLRSAESSLEAVRSGRGAQPPGYSAHNFGLAIDLDLDATMLQLGVRRKAELDAFMESHGWFCHRRDHLLKSEAWHYNFLRVGTVVGAKFKATSGWVEARIVELYGPQLAPNDRMCQEMLRSARLYSGEIDGVLGRLSQESTRVFQRAWNLKPSGVLDKRTRRTLAFVTAGKLVKRIDERAAA